MVFFVCCPEVSCSANTPRPTDEKANAGGGSVWPTSGQHTKKNVLKIDLRSTGLSGRKSQTQGELPCRVLPSGFGTQTRPTHRHALRVSWFHEPTSLNTSARPRKSSQRTVRAAGLYRHATYNTRNKHVQSETSQHALPTNTRVRPNTDHKKQTQEYRSWSLNVRGQAANDQAHATGAGHVT